MADLFISYKSDDRARVAPLVTALGEAGFSIWWDAQIAGGTAWSEEIEAELDVARCILVVWSHGSVGSEGRFVRDEARRALRRHVYLPVRIDPVEPPLGFGEVQVLSLEGWRANGDEPQFAEVVRSARRMIDGAVLSAPEDRRRVDVLTIDPPGRLVRHADGRSVTLEPPAMRLLVALLDADGAILSREDLVEVWGEDRIVGEDSIGSVACRLRRDLRDLAAGVFEIETIAKVGVRLVRTGDVATAAGDAVKVVPKHGSAARWRARSARVILAGVALCLALAAFAWWAGRGPIREERPLALAAPALLGEQLRAAAARAGIALASGDGDLRLTATLDSVGTGAQLTFRLDDLRDNRTLWGQTHKLAASNEAVFSAEASRVAEVIACGLPAIEQRRPVLEPSIVAQMFRMCGADDHAAALSRARELVSAAPGFVDGQLGLAEAAAAEAATRPADQTALLAEGLAAADRAIALRPDLADGYAMRALLLPFTDPVAREDALRVALGKPDSHCQCAEQLLGDFLMQVGRLREGLGLYERARARAPASAMALFRLSHGYDIGGQTQRGGDLLADYEARFGPMPALRYAHALYLTPRPWPLPPRGQYGNAASEVAVATALAAIHDGGADAQAKAVAALRAVPVTRSLEYPIAALLAELGDGAGALAVADASRRAGTSFAGPGRYPGTTSALLWDPRMAGLWTAPGFPAFLDATGFVRYWRARGIGPDVCNARLAPPFCHVLALPRVP